MPICCLRISIACTLACCAGVRARGAVAERAMSADAVALHFVTTMSYVTLLIINRVIRDIEMHARIACMHRIGICDLCSIK